MKNLRNLDVEFSELLRILSRPQNLKIKSYNLTSAEIGNNLPSGKFRVVWHGGELKSDAPSVILAGKFDIDQVLPRLLALPSAIVPITSVVKFWDVDDFEYGNPYCSNALEEAAALGFVGLIIGELTSLIHSEEELRTMGMDSVRRTLSFVCAQAIIKGWTGKSLVDIANRWIEASSLTENEINPQAASNILDVSGFLSALSGDKNFEATSPEVLGDRIQLWLESQKSWDQRDLLNRSIPQITRELKSVSSREKRYDLVVGALNSLADEARSPLEQGFLISLIEPGSFEFVNLARSIDPTGLVMMAYSTFVTMLGKESALKSFNGFGWTVLRQAFHQGCDVVSDISIDELRIILDKRRSTPIPFRTRSPWMIDVEIAPMVVGCFANVAKRKASSQRTQETSEAVERQEALRGKLINAMRALDDLYGLVEGERLRPDGTVGKPRGRKR